MLHRVVMAHSNDMECDSVEDEHNSLQLSERHTKKFCNITIQGQR